MFFSDLPIWFTILLLLIGLAIITKGADKFVDSAVTIAQKTLVPKVIIGATIVSLGTTLPEFSVAAFGGIFDRSQTAVGGAIGSTICNIGLILGTCILIRPILLQRRLYWQPAAIMVLAGIAVWLLSLDGYLSRLDSLVLTAGLVGYLYFNIRAISRVRKNRGNMPGPEPPPEKVTTGQQSLKNAVIWLVVGAISVAIGAILIVETAVNVAHWLGVPELVIGLTVVAFGTSLPEYVTGLTATVKGHGDITLGTMIGADILDILWVLGPGALSFSLLPLERQTLTLDYPVMLTIMVLLAVFTITGRQLARWQGGILIGIYGAYLALMFLLFV
ncbi:MAG TPA: calcium/sodium antiporter [Dehalococcoidia bacterium]|nr:calcium/sodium antiporter [Dehalococcoidia bacterium]